MPIFRNSAEGGVHGTNVTPGNSGGGSGDPWSAVEVTGAAAFTFDSTTPAHGDLGYKLQYASSEQCRVRWEWSPSVTQGMASFYMRLPEDPDAGSQFLNFGVGASTVGLSLLGPGTPRRLRVRDFTGANLYDTVQLALDTTYRVEFRFDTGTTASDGVIEFAVYEGDALTPFDSFSSAAANAGSGETSNAVRIGKASQSSTTSTVVFLDSLQVWIGADTPAALGELWPIDPEINIIAAQFPATIELASEFDAPFVPNEIEAAFTVAFRIAAEFEAPFVPNDPPELQAIFSIGLQIAATFQGAPAPPPVPEAPEPILQDVLALELNGDLLVLDLEEGLVVESANFGWPDQRPVVHERPGVDGTIDTTERFGARAVTVDLIALRGDQTWQQVRASLGRFLGANVRPTLIYTHEGIEYRIGLAPDLAAGTTDMFAFERVQLAFRAPDPFFYPAFQTISTQAFQAGTTGRLYPWTAPRTYPVSDAVTGLIDITNAGDVAVWPVVRISGGDTLTNIAFSVENQTTSETFSLLSTTIPAGHYLEVDMRERTVRVDGDPDTSRFSRVNFPSSTWVRLVPGTNRLRFATTTLQPDASLTVEWADPFLWPGGLGGNGVEPQIAEEQQGPLELLDLQIEGGGFDVIDAGNGT